MAIKLIAEVISYLKRDNDLKPAERLVLLLIAERANEQSREAWSGGADDWQLGQLARLSPTGLRDVLQRLAQRGLEVRMALGKDAKGRPVFAVWNRQTTYRLPILLGDSGPSPTGDAQATVGRRLKRGTGDGIRHLRRRNSTAQATEFHPVGDGGPSPYPSSPSGPSGPVTDYVLNSPRPAAPRSAPSEEEAPAGTLTAEQARAEARAIASRYGRAKTSHWTEGTAPVGEPNPLYDPAIAAQALDEAQRQAEYEREQRER